MKRFMQKLEKSNGKYSNAQSLHQKYLKIARYSCAIFNTNLAHCCISEPNILNRTQVIRSSFKFSGKLFSYRENTGTAIPRQAFLLK